MVDFRKLLTQDQIDRLDKFAQDRIDVSKLSNAEFGAQLIHYYHNMARSEYRKGDPVYDGQMFWLLIPEMIRRMYNGNPPTRCPCEGCTCSDWMW